MPNKGYKQTEEHRIKVTEASRMPRSLRGGGYHAIHKWLVKHYGKADKCQNIECPGGEIAFHWALIKGKEYEHKRENFMMLGVKCHRNYDLTPEKIERAKATLREGYAKPVMQCDLEGFHIRQWVSIGEAAQKLGFNKANISQVCNGKRKTANGFIWRFI